MVRVNRISISIFFLAAAASCLSPTSHPFLVQADDAESTEDNEVIDIDAVEAVEEVAPEEAATEEAATEEIQLGSDGGEDETAPEVEDEAATKPLAEDAPASPEEEIAHVEEEAAALKEAVHSRIAEKLFKPLALTKKNMKKVAAMGVGVWGAATGIGWAMQNYGTGPMKE